MKNIKVSFHHPNFIYKFKIDLLVVHQSTPWVTIDFENVGHRFQEIKRELILNSEEKKMLESLSYSFQKEFIKKYEMGIIERKRKKQENIVVDYLGENIEEHLSTFLEKMLKLSEKNQNNINSVQTNVHLLIRELYTYLKIITTANQFHKHEAITTFASPEFLNALMQLVVTFRDFQLQKNSQAFVHYHCIITILNLLLEDQKEQIQLLRIGSNMALICFKEAKKYLKYSALSEISSGVFKIWEMRLQRQENINWINEYVQEKYQFLETIVNFLNKTNHNVMLLYETLNFLQSIRLKSASMNQLLLFVTGCINSKILNLIEDLYENYRLGNISPKETLTTSFPDEFTQNFGKKIIRLAHKQIPEKKWNNFYRQGYKIVAVLKEKFSEFKAGKIFMNKQRKLSIKEEKQRLLEQIQVLGNFQKCQVAYSDHHEVASQLKQIKIKNQQLLEKYQKAVNDNEQLVRINKWYEELVNEKTNIIKELQKAVSEFINIKELNKNGKKISIFSSTYSFKIQPTLTNHALSKQLSQQHTLQIPNQNIQNNPQSQSFDILPPPPPPPPNFTRSSHKSNSRNSHNSNLKNLLPPPPPPLLIPPQFTLPPPPLPPPLIGFGNSGSKLGFHQHDDKNKKEMKMVNWAAVEISRVKDSFWQNVQEVELDQKEIEQFFCKNPAPKFQNTFKPKKQEKQLKTLLSASRGKNIEIVLKKIKVEIRALPKIIETLDQNVLNLTNVQSFLKIIPTDKQIQEFSEIPEDTNFEDWAIADQYVMTVIQITNYAEILRAIKFKIEFPSISKIYQKNIQQFIQFFEKLESDDFLKAFFQEMLSIGNFMNQNSSRGSAYGFRFQSIQKSYSITNNNNTQTLFEYILFSMKKRGRNFPSTSSYYKANFIVPIEVLRQDLKQMRKNCENVQECLLRSNEEDERMPEYFLAFYIQMRQQISLLEQKFNIAYRIAKSVADFYCQKIQVEKIMKNINDFRSRVKKFVEKNKVVHIT